MKEPIQIVTLLLLVGMARCVSAEELSPLSLAERCDLSEVICVADVITVREISGSSCAQLALATCNVIRTLKGHCATDFGLLCDDERETELLLDRPMLSTDLVNVLYLGPNQHGLFDPEFAPGKRYILFLSGQVSPAVYRRTTRLQIERRGQESSLLWSESLERQVRELIKEVTRKVEIDTQTPSGQEAELPLSDRERSLWLGRKAEWRNGKEAVERGWWESGRLAWEVAKRDGVPHGRFRAWHDSGDLYCHGAYKDGLLDGPMSYVISGYGTVRILWHAGIPCSAWQSEVKFDTRPAEFNGSANDADTPEAPRQEAQKRERAKKRRAR